MWPFRKKEEKPNLTLEGINKLKAFRDVGESFNYLGRKCVVTDHSMFMPWGNIVPMLQFDYVDDIGVIHSGSAMLRELPAIIAQQDG